MRVEWSIETKELRNPAVLTSGDSRALYFYLGDGSALTVWGTLPELREWLRNGLAELDAHIAKSRVVHTDAELEKKHWAGEGAGEGVDSKQESGYIGPRAG